MISSVCRYTNVSTSCDKCRLFRPTSPNVEVTMCDPCNMADRNPLFTYLQSVQETLVACSSFDGKMWLSLKYDYHKM